MSLSSNQEQMTRIIFALLFFPTFSNLFFSPSCLLSQVASYRAALLASTATAWRSTARSQRQQAAIRQQVCSVSSLPNPSRFFGGTGALPLFTVHVWLVLLKRISPSPSQAVMRQRAHRRKVVQVGLGGVSSRPNSGVFQCFSAVNFWILRTLG